MSYSQREEESVILDHFGDSPGSYLDIGAFDGKTFSNTRALAEMGWEGVCVEPGAYAFGAMVDDPPPRAKLVHAAVGPRTGLCSFMLSKDAVSSTDRAHARKWQGAVRFTPIFTVQVSVNDLLKDFPGPYRFINLDTEGTSSYLLRALSPLLSALDTELVCYEHDGDFVHVEGFTEAYRSPENVILRRK